MAGPNTGRFLLKGKKNDSEIEQYEALIRKKPDDDRAYVRLAELHARAGNEDKAIELYEKAAILFEKKGFLNKAKAVLKQALMLNPEHGKINVLLADYDRQSGLIKDATIRYNTAVNYYAKTGNKLAAISILRKMVELYPGNMNFSIKLANMLVSEKMNHEAEKLLVPVAEELKGSDKINEYATVLKLLYAASDGDGSVGRDLVNLYLKSGSFSNALAVLQKLIIDNPESLELLEKLAFVFERMGEKKKLVATYKQIASVCTIKQNFAERDSFYRKILELDPDDREALSVLNEQGKLRDLISDKIDSSMMNVDDDDQIDLVLDIDIEGEDDEPSEDGKLQENEDSPPVDIETVIKEANVFLSYRLFSKAIDKVHTYKEWSTSSEALDILIQANIELGEVENAGDLIIMLIDLNIEKGNIQSAIDLLADAEAMLSPEDNRIALRKENIEKAGRDLESDIVENDIFEGIPDVEKEKAPDIKVDADHDDDNVEPVALTLEAPAPSEETEEEEPVNVAELTDNDDQAEFENMTMDILSELEEPPQEQLDELEFYISIEDFTSATQLLQDLLVNFPDSRFLSGMKEMLPVKKEEDISATMQDMRSATENRQGEEINAQDILDIASGHLSMGMFKEAIDSFNKVLEFDPQSIAAMVGLSEAFMTAGKPDKALKSLKDAARIVEDDEMLEAIKEQMEEIEKLSLGNQKKGKK